MQWDANGNLIRLKFASFFSFSLFLWRTFDAHSILYFVIPNTYSLWPIHSFETHRINVSDGEKEVQRTMVELLTQLDGFDKHHDVKIMMATNRIDCLDPALIRAGRIDRKIEIPYPDQDVSSERSLLMKPFHLIFYLLFSFTHSLSSCAIHRVRRASLMYIPKQWTWRVSNSRNWTSIMRNWGKWRHCLKGFLPGKALLTSQFLTLVFPFSGADIASICSTAGIIALRDMRKFITMNDFLEAKKTVLQTKKSQASAVNRMFAWRKEGMKSRKILSPSFLVPIK